MEQPDLPMPALARALATPANRVAILPAEVRQSLRQAMHDDLMRSSPAFARAEAKRERRRLRNRLLLSEASAQPAVAL